MTQTKAELLGPIRDNIEVSAQNDIRFQDADSSHYVALQAPSTVSSNVTFTLPAADGSAGYVLKTDGSGNLGWTNDPAGQWTTSGSNLYFTGGNIGIGDSSPSNPLSVTGASAFNGDVQFTGASYNVTWDKSADDLIFNDNATAAFGTGSDLKIYHDSANNYWNATNGHTYMLANGNNIYLRGVNNEDGLIVKANAAVELYYDNVKKFQTLSSGAEVKGNLVFEDSNEIRMGDSGDLQLYHNGNSWVTDQGAGALKIHSVAGGVQILGGASNELMAQFIPDGAAELYHNNAKKIETTADGIEITGKLFTSSHIDLADDVKLLLGTSDDLQIYHGSNTNWIETHNDHALKITKGANSELLAQFTPDGAVELYHNNTKKFETTSAGVQVNGDFKILNGGDDIFFDASGNWMRWDDNVKIQLGNSGDCDIFHDGTNTMIDNDTGDLKISSSNLRLRGGLVGIYNEAQTETMFLATADGAVELYHNNTKKFETTSDGALVTGRFTTNSDYNYLQGYSASTSTLTLKKSNSQANSIDYLQCRDSNNTLYHTIQGGGHIKLQDNVILKIGDSDDLKLWHSGSHSYIQDNGTGNLAIGANDLHLMNAATTEYYIKCTQNGSVQLYHDNANKLETFSDGVRVYGDHLTVRDPDHSGGSTVCYVEGENTNGAARWAVGQLSSGHESLYVKNHANASVIFSVNGTDRCYVDTTGHFVPASNDTYDLGTSNYRWRDLYTGDLDLSNEHVDGGNDVDGTWGSYKIQEGENDLFLINRRNGKKYKFALQEVA